MDAYTLRPGFIWNYEHRQWSVPLMFGCEVLHKANTILTNHLPYHARLDFLFPAKPTKLESVSHFAIEAVLGNLDHEKY